ncbi:MAG: endopeptidase La [Firmicutes bacterium]|nr:endopeptidase La [Bacillota bacterium]
MSEKLETRPAENEYVSGGHNEYNGKLFNAVEMMGVVAVPYVTITCEIGKLSTANGVRDAYRRREKIVLITQHETDGNLYKVGCICAIKHMSEVDSHTLKAVVVGEARVNISKVVNDNEYLQVEISKFVSKNTATIKAYELFDKAYKTLMQWVKIDPNIPLELQGPLFMKDQTPERFADLCVHVIFKEYEMQQKVLEETDVEKRLELVCAGLQESYEAALVRKSVNERVTSNINKTQKEMYLREQMRAINEELNGDVDEIEEFADKIKTLNMPKDIEEKSLKEVNKLKKLPFGSPEVGYVRNFIETVIELPWQQKTEDNLNIKAARVVLDADHYALAKVKERIMETMAVMQTTGKVSGQILCFVGPPGVGKTSIAKSIAKALGRNFVQVSLGGVSDESIIRGHRRTYVGAMPGRIIAGMKQAGTINPVFLLDEIDKVTRDIKGDPASALLEVLDPEQNNNFKDHFLEVPYDLSKVLFITTANTLDTIPKPLLDRMEIIKLSTYTEIEKIQIAKRHLIAKQEALAGLKEGTIKLTDAVLSKIIREYTFEAGVRNLERAIAKICRKTAMMKLELGKAEAVTTKTLADFMGNEFSRELNMYKGGNVGEVVGLATAGGVGGVPLLIEVALSKGKDKVVLTGQMGKVAQESAQASYSLVKTMAKELKIDESRFETTDLHVHFPASHSGVEGPSAGIATTTAIVSAFTLRALKPHYSMTGEVSLRGRVLPIGGTRDKLIAAARVGAINVILPKDNEHDLWDIPEEVMSKLKINLVSNIREVLHLALEK